MSTGMPLADRRVHVGRERDAIGRRQQNSVDALVGELLHDLLLLRRVVVDGGALPGEVDVELRRGPLGALPHLSSRTWPAWPWESSRARVACRRRARRRRPLRPPIRRRRRDPPLAGSSRRARSLPPTPQNYNEPGRRDVGPRIDDGSRDSPFQTRCCAAQTQSIIRGKSHGEALRDATRGLAEPCHVRGSPSGPLDSSDDLGMTVIGR